MQVFRLHIRTGDSANHSFAFSYCLRKEILGVGWQVEVPTETNLTWDMYEQLALKKFSPEERRGFDYLYKNVKTDDLIWTRNKTGDYYLAQALSPWEYFDTEDGRRADIVNIVRCKIQRVPLADDVPGKVVACFRPRRAIQRINDSTVALYSKLLWNQLSESEYYPRQINDSHNIFAYLDSKTTEDVIFIYLQTEGWLMIPNSRQTDTMNYEYIAISRHNYDRAVVQVKTGHTPLSSEREEWSSSADQVFLFQANGNYLGSEHPDVHRLMPEDIEVFMWNNVEIMPSAVQRWIEYLESEGLR